MNQKQDGRESSSPYQQVLTVGLLEGQRDLPPDLESEIMWGVPESYGDYRLSLLSVSSSHMPELI